MENDFMPAPKGHPNYDTEGLAGRPKKHDDAFIEDQVEKFKTWLKYPKNIFYHSFVLDQFILPKYLYQWAERSERFRDTLEMAKYKQEEKLKEGALEKVFDNSFTKFLLINNHGMQKYADKTESKVSGDSQNPIALAITEAMGQSKHLVEDDEG